MLTSKRWQQRKNVGLSYKTSPTPAVEDEIESVVEFADESESVGSTFDLNAVSKENTCPDTVDIIIIININFMMLMMLKEEEEYEKEDERNANEGDIIMMVMIIIP